MMPTATATITLDDVEWYSVIYDFDIASDQRVARWKPPARQLRKVWTMTERDDFNGDLAYAKLPKHRKYCAMLTPDEFDAFVRHCGLVADTIETMGSIGAPGFGFGWAPAICFNCDDNYAGTANAYVTPIPRGKPEDFAQAFPGLELTVEELEAIQQRVWDELKALAVERWGF